jgi:hypothetical protein
MSTQREGELILRRLGWVCPLPLYFPKPLFPQPAPLRHSCAIPFPILRRVSGPRGAVWHYANPCSGALKSAGCLQHTMRRKRTPICCQLARMMVRVSSSRSCVSGGSL